MQKIIRGIIAGTLFGILSYVIGAVVWGVLFVEESKAHAHLWRPDDDVLMTAGMPIASIITGLTISLAYALFYKGLPKEGLKKGFFFGCILWLILGFAGGIFWYTIIPITPALLLASWLDPLLSMPIGGMLIAAIYGKSLEKG